MVTTSVRNHRASRWHLVGRREAGGNDNVRNHRASRWHLVGRRRPAFRSALHWANIETGLVVIAGAKSGQ